MHRFLITAWITAVIILILVSLSGFAQRMFAPAQLDPAHAKNVKKCSACHESFNGTPDGKCLNCHRNMMPEIRSGKTIHAQTSFSCTACHLIHGRSLGRNLISENAAFHGTDNFFRGKHKTASCSSCHKNRKFTRLSRACEKCHGTRHRNPTFNSNCSKCHVVTSWKALRILHYKGSHCRSCHRAPSNHYGTDCAACHNYKSWKEATFKHPPVPGHTYRSFPCKTCHPKNFKNYSCLKCHSSNHPQQD